MNDIFFITSVINTGGARWSYSDKRSVQSPQERYEETLKTIDTIRKLYSGADILLVEGSAIEDDMKQRLQCEVEYFVDVHQNPIVQQACLATDRKGYGEAVQTLLAVQFLQEKQIQFKRLFKISGRYFLNERFQLANFSTTEYTFNKTSPGMNPGAHLTVLYSVPSPLLQNFHTVLQECIQIYQHGPAGLEEILPRRCNPKTLIDSIGVSGYVAVCGSFFTV